MIYDDSFTSNKTKPTSNAMKQFRSKKARSSTLALTCLIFCFFHPVVTVEPLLSGHAREIAR